MLDPIVDVSPDMPFGAQTGGQNTGIGVLAGGRSLRDLHAYSYSAYLTGREGHFRLYIALLGRGLVRIDTALRTAKPPL